MLRYVLMYVAITTYIYGGMWATSKLEPRKHPWGLWRGQYRALFPGDLGLGLALVAGVALMWSTNDTTPWWWKLVSLILGIALGTALFLFQISPEEKVDGRMYAPTRIWHQLFIWGLISAGALAYELPAIGLAVLALAYVLPDSAATHGARSGHLDRMLPLGRGSGQGWHAHRPRIPHPRGAKAAPLKEGAG